MNTLKMGPAGHAVSGPERSSRCPVDRETQHPRAALLIARDAREQPTRSTETSPRPQTHAKPKSFRVAIKVGGKILFINTESFNQEVPGKLSPLLVSLFLISRSNKILHFHLF